MVHGLFQSYQPFRLILGDKHISPGGSQIDNVLFIVCIDFALLQNEAALAESEVDFPGGADAADDEGVHEPGFFENFLSGHLESEAEMEEVPVEEAPSNPAEDEDGLGEIIEETEPEEEDLIAAPPDGSWMDQTQDIQVYMLFLKHIVCFFI